MSEQYRGKQRSGGRLRLELERIATPSHDEVTCLVLSSSSRWAVRKAPGFKRQGKREPCPLRVSLGLRRELPNDQMSRTRDVLDLDEDERGDGEMRAEAEFVQNKIIGQ